MGTGGSGDENDPSLGEKRVTKNPERRMRTMMTMIMMMIIVIVEWVIFFNLPFQMKIK